MEIYGKSCDIEFGLDFTEEPILTASNGVSQKKNQISALLVTIDDIIGISDNCLSNRRKVTEAVREKLKLDGIEVVAISRDSFSQLCRYSDDSTALLIFQGDYCKNIYGALWNIFPVLRE